MTIIESHRYYSISPSGVPVGAVAGAVVGVIVGILVIVVIVIFIVVCMRSRSGVKSYRTTSTVSNSSVNQDPGIPLRHAATSRDNLLQTEGNDYNEPPSIEVRRHNAPFTQPPPAYTAQPPSTYTPPTYRPTPPQPTVPAAKPAAQGPKSDSLCMEERD